jgi:hypothetical protein
VAKDLAIAHPEFRTKLIARFAAANSKAAILLGAVLAEVGTEEAAVALLHHDEPELIEGPLRRVVNLVTDSRTPLPNANGYLLSPVEATSLRRRLAAQLVLRDEKRCAVASRLLVQIRLKRVMNGWPPNEPLHPDIALLGQIDGNWELCCVGH